MWNTLRQTVVPDASCEQDPEFRDVLQDVARRGIQAGAVLGIAVVVLFVAIHAAFLGSTIGLSYGDDVVVLWDKLLLVAIGGIAIWSVRFLGLNGMRILATVLVIVAAFASVADDMAGGDTSFSQGYVAFIYLLAVLAVPYRAVHTVGLGAALAGMLYGAVELLPAVFASPPVRHIHAHYVYLASFTVLLAGMSGLLYSMRYRQYRQRREAEDLRAQVESLEAAKSRFFVNLSHEFRTPLTLLRGPLDDVLAGRYGEVGGRFRQRVREMRLQARKLSDLVDQLLDLSKLEDGAMPLHAREVDLVALVVRYASVFESALDRKEIILRLDVPPEPLPIWCDVEKFERVLTNLFSNALKYTPPGGTIRIRLTRDGAVNAGDAASSELVDGAADRPVGGSMGGSARGSEEGAEVRTIQSNAVLSFRDSGQGIEPEILAIVFDRFAAAGVSRDGQASTGIGLALVREIVERHGGVVEVKSEPGFGAEFIVRMPLGRDHLHREDIHLIPEHARDDPVAELPEYVDEELALDTDPPEHPPDAPLVLIVDDNAAVRSYLRDLLLTRYRVQEAADAEGGFALTADLRPDLIVSDVMMPGDGGFELCRRIKADDRLAATPVVLLTARTEDEARREGFAAGADAYLAKPFSSDELLLIAENLIEVRRLLRERMTVPDWLAPAVPAIPSRDAEFLERVQRTAAEHLGDANFGVEWLASEVGLSTRQLQRRLKASVQLTAAGFIKAMRLEHAAKLLSESDLQVQEVADAVGYRDVNYFSKLFRQIHGVPPSEYASKHSGTRDRSEAHGAEDAT